MKITQQKKTLFTFSIVSIKKKFFPYDLYHQQHARRKLFGEDTIAEKVGSYISTALNLKTLAQQKLIDYFAFNLQETTEDQNLNAEGIYRMTATVQLIHYYSQKNNGKTIGPPVLLNLFGHMRVLTYTYI